MPRPEISIVSSLLLASFAASGCRKDSDAAHLPPARSAAAPAPASQPAGKPAAPRKAENAPAVQRINTGRGAVLNGTTKARRTSMLSPRVSGLVTKVLVKDGDVVNKGAPLVLLDRRDFYLHLRQAQAARATARAQLDAVRVEWKRLKSLLKARAIPRGQFEKVDSQFKVAKAGLAQAEVAVSMARSALGKTTVKAPYRALVSKVMTAVGNYATMMPPTMLVRLEEIDRLELEIRVPEAEMRRVKAGTAVELRFTAIGEKRRSKIHRVVPSLDPRTRSFAAIIELPNPKHSLRPGMFVEVALAGAGR